MNNDELKEAIERYLVPDYEGNQIQAVVTITDSKENDGHNNISVQSIYRGKNISASFNLPKTYTRLGTIDFVPRVADMLRTAIARAYVKANVIEPKRTDATNPDFYKHHLDYLRWLRLPEYIMNEGTIADYFKAEPV